jgi:hypothetical protein
MVCLVVFGRALLVVIFATAVVTKVSGRARFEDFSAWIRQLPLGAARAFPMQTAALTVGCELAVVLMLLLPWTAEAGLALGAAVLVTFSAVSVEIVRRGIRTPCRCFGASRRPLTLEHACRDTVLAGVAIAAAVLGGFGAATSSAPAGAEVLVAVGAVFSAIAFVVWDDLAFLLSDGSRLTPRGRGRTTGGSGQSQ